MSRYSDYDDYDEEDGQEERQRQWRENYAAALRSESGRRFLRDFRDALLALPEHKLIQSAMCTVGGADQRAPKMSEQDKAAYAAQYAGLPRFSDAGAQRWAEMEARGRAELHARGRAELHARGRAELHDDLAGLIAREGEGVCAVGAFLWHRKVKEGAGPAEAFASLPLLFDHEEGDPLTDTADLGKQAGVAWELAWELAYMNDETFRGKTPEERHAAFVAWIDEQLAGLPAAS
jgi:hypothetical protein